MKVKFNLIAVFLFFSIHSYAQHDAPFLKSKDDFQLKDVFKEAHFHGHIRNYFMNTINRGDLKDYYANATGGALGFTTGNFKGFEIGVKGIFTFRTFGNDLGVHDAITGKNAKWEYELFDVLNKGNFKDLDRLEELFIRYRFGASYLTYGKIATEYTRLLNSSDGRMKPFAHRGGWAHLDFNSPHQLDLGWINGVSPRATTEWFSMEEAIGLFYNGFQPNGEEAEYHENYHSSGLAVLNYQFNKENFSVNIYDFYLDKLTNTIWTEAHYSIKNFDIGVQYVYQNPFQYSEDLSYEHRYVQPDENGQVLSSQLSWSNTKWDFAFAYTHAFDTGRFLFPKELGRDHFFTSIPRSRLEGLGNANVYTLKAEYHMPLPDFYLGVAIQQLEGPETGNFEFNKYNVDESFQVNSHLRFVAHEFFEGLSFDLLWVYRQNQNYTNAQSIFNKSNFNQINFVTNFNF
ncbi:hypothetical protein INR75_19955 [Zunongwangia sp. SCSIO 43204]|uniref:hypothetical protein n=1 Tax=Zunongwangia sp. SCSIO 43204 TaxID=2779359 RepID=UPI001CA8862C|nr:hypothetical protein [Zunongwangia sp. SCSIO 43204]UAB84395.1 hypothetical protein INR75_19955 [Zunongwangia sp. SCSIO 43204]